MMKKKNRSSKEKLEIVLEGLRDDTVFAEVCNRHQISQTTHYKWRDKLLSSSDSIFARGAVEGREQKASRNHRGFNC